jgi:hypothetical protein
LRFTIPGPRLRVPDVAAIDGPMSGLSGLATIVGGAAEGSGFLQIRP